jgi:hypothetical protein
VNARTITPACPNGHGSRYCVFGSHRWYCGLCGESFVLVDARKAAEESKDVSELIAQIHSNAKATP